MNNNHLETVSDDMLDQVSGGGLLSNTIAFADDVIDGAVGAASDVIGGGLSFLGSVFTRLGGFFGR